MVGGYVFETSLGYLYKETCEDQKEKKEKKKEEEEGKGGREGWKRRGRRLNSPFYNEPTPAITCMAQSTFTRPTSQHCCTGD
jgi:hypothetical protein